MIKIINKLISKIKGESFAIDERVSVSYIIRLLVSRLMMTLRGLCYFSIKRAGLIFIGSNVKIKAAGYIKTGKNLTIDRGAYIDALSTDGINFGDNVSIGKRTTIECTGSLKHLGKGLTVGNNVGLNSDCFYGCAGGISIDDDTIIGNYVSFHSENHNYQNNEVSIRLQGVNHKGIIIGKNCWIGAKATILDGVTMQSGCIVAAGAVVKAGRYTENGIYGGVPAKLLKFRTTTGQAVNI